MSGNSIVLQLNLMEWNRGYLVFKAGENANASARIKGFYKFCAEGGKPGADAAEPECRPDL